MRHQERRAQGQYEQEQYEAAQQQAQIDAAARNAVAQNAAPQYASSPAPGPAAADDMIAQLQQLAALKASGVLSDEEFAAAKQKLLS